MLVMQGLYFRLERCLLSYWVRWELSVCCESKIVPLLTSCSSYNDRYNAFFARIILGDEFSTYLIIGG